MSESKLKYSMHTKPGMICSLCRGFFDHLMIDGMYRDENDKAIHYKYEGQGACDNCHKLAHPAMPSLWEINERRRMQELKNNKK